jgi:large subunit ribosomal protein L21
MTYAIIKVGGKQYRVREGEKLLVDRLKTDEGKTFTPDLLFVPDGDGSGVTVTATVVGHVKGDKIRIGKYKRRTGYKRHNGFRAAISRLEITIGAGTQRAPAKPKRAAKAEPVDTAAVAESVQPADAVETAPAEGSPVEVVAEDTGGAPSGYESMTVAQISAAAKEWGHEELEAALGYEQAHGARKGAIAALEGALKKDEEPTEEEAE